MRAFLERHIALTGFAAFALVAAVTRVAEYQKAVAGDVTEFLYVGETVLQGGLPYADAAYSKGPLLALLFAAIEPVVGESPTAVHLTLVPFAAAAALALAGYVARYAGLLAGALAGLTYAAVSAFAPYAGADAESEQYAVAPLFGALWMCTRQSPAGPAGAGVLFACAVLLHPAFGVAAPALAVELWLGTAPGARLRRFGLAIAGALVPIAAALAWLAAGGALADMLHQVGGQVGNSLQSDAGATAVGDRSLDRLEIPASAVWAFGAVGSLVAFRDSRLARPAVVLALVMAGVLFRTKVASYELEYQYYPALPAICGAAVLGIASLWRPPRLERLALAVLVLAFPVWDMAIEPQLKLLRKDPAARNPYGAAVYPVAGFVRAHTKPDDPIIVAGGRAEVYWYTERRAPTRFFDVFGSTGRPEYLAERRRDIARHPPAAVVVMQNVSTAAEPELDRLVRSGAYRRAYFRAGSAVWLRSRPRGPAP